MNTLAGLRPTSDELAEPRIVPVDLEVVCLWSVFGLMLTALFVAFGFGGDIAQALTLAG
jgi:hypothetical protein